MKKFRSIVMFTLGMSMFGLVALASGGCQKTADADMSGGGDAVAVHSADATTMIVHGMSCPLCATNVDKQLMRLSGVRAVDVNLDTGVIVAWHDSSGSIPSHEALRAAVEESGFTFVRFADARE